LKLTANFHHIFICASNEEYGLEMHQFFCWDIVDHINEENFFLQDLSPGVYHRNND